MQRIPAGCGAKGEANMLAVGKAPRVRLSGFKDSLYVPLRQSLSHVSQHHNPSQKYQAYCLCKRQQPFAARYVIDKIGSESCATEQQ